METLLATAGRVGAMLTARGDTVAVSESSAGGLVSAALLSIPGASRYFMGGAVVYTAVARSSLLAIGEAEMAGLRSSSEPYAMLLARTLRTRFGVTWGIAETGAAGPAGNRYGDPAGLTCLAVSGPVEWVLTLRTGQDDRVANMRAFGAGLLEVFEGVLASAK